MPLTPQDVRALRARTGWSTYRVAELIGCNQSTISRIENSAEGDRINRVVEKALERLIADNPPVDGPPPTGRATERRSAEAQ